MSELERLFNPRGIAVIGASADPTRTGGQPLRALSEYGYAGRVYPVNPKYPELGSHRCYSSVADIGEDCDLAVIALPAAQVPAVIAACGRRGIQYAVVLGGGFREAGPAGAAIEAAMLAAAGEHGVRIVGPNCLGLVNVHARVFAAFGSITREPTLKPGAVSAVIQSGGMGNSLVIRCALAGAGFRYLVSTGNEVDIGMAELIEAYVEDVETRVILIYLEGVADGRLLMSSLKRACVAGKPVVVLKGGKTEQGKAAAASHTANLTGSYDVYRSAFRQCGAIEVNELDEAADYVLCLLAERLPRGRNIAVMGASGGSAAVFSDMADRCGLKLAPFSTQTTAALKSSLPPLASVTNPVDYTSGYPRPETRDDFQRAFEAVLADPAVDQLALLFATPGRRQLQISSELLAQATALSDKPVLIFSVIPAEFTPEGIDTLRAAGIPVLPSPSRVARAMAMLADFAAAQTRMRITTSEPDQISLQMPPISAAALTLDEHRSKTIVAQAGIPVTRDILVPIDAPAEATRGITFPVAVKIVSADIPHKSDIGAVELNVADNEQLQLALAAVIRSARHAAPNAQLTGVLVSEMVHDGLEVILGAVNDPAFGPVVIFGLGGVLTEVLSDVTYRVAPFGKDEARLMIGELRASRIFRGTRGRVARDVEALADTLLCVSNLAWQLRDRLVELDINPLLVLAEGKGVVAADALLVLR